MYPPLPPTQMATSPMPLAHLSSWILPLNTTTTTSTADFEDLRCFVILLSLGVFFEDLIVETSLIKGHLVVNYDFYLAFLAAEEGVVLTSQVPLHPSKTIWVVVPAEAGRTARSPAMLY